MPVMPPEYMSEVHLLLRDIIHNGHLNGKICFMYCILKFENEELINVKNYYTYASPTHIADWREVLNSFEE